MMMMKKARMAIKKNKKKKKTNRESIEGIKKEKIKNEIIKSDF